MITAVVNVSGLEVLQRLDTLPDKVHAAVEEKFAVLIQALREKVAGNLSGKVLQTKSGNLLRSLNSGVERQGSLLVGFVEIDPVNENVKEYALAHEYGGKSYYVIPVGKAGVLANIETGFFSKHDVFHPPAKERSYLRSALAEMTPEIDAGIEEAIAEALAL